MEQLLPSFHNKPSVTIAGVFSWQFHHSGMVQHPSPGAPACSTEPVWGVVHPGCWTNSKSPLRPHCRNQTPSDTSQQLKLFLSHSAQAPGVQHLSLTWDFSQEPSLGSCYPLPSRLSQNQKEPAFIRPKPGSSHNRSKEISDLLHILFNNHHFFKDTFFHSSQAHFADRQKVNLRPVFC